MDATHTGSSSNPWSPLEILRLRSKQLRKSIYYADENQKDNLPAKNNNDNIEHELDYTKALLEVVGSTPSLAEPPKVKERLNMLKDVLADIEDHYVTSKDEDARIITVATVTSGENGNEPQLEELVNQSRANSMQVETVVGDTAYSGKDNIILANDEDNGFELVARLNPTISHGTRKDDDRFDYNKDASMFVCSARTWQ